MNSTPSAAAVIGRWQMPHIAHLALIEHAFSLADQVVIVIGSAFRSPNPKNPFSYEARRAMLLSMLTPEQLLRVKFLGVRDVYSDARWVQQVSQGVQALVAPGAHVTLVGFEKDASSYYLKNFPAWAYADAGRSVDIDATRLRELLFGGTPAVQAMERLKPFLHPKVLDFLALWTTGKDYQERCAEHQANEAYKVKYPAGPYYTGDAIVEAAGRFLMIERDGALGKGTFAWPGGHEEPGESGADAALRELGEETTLPFSAAELRQFIVAEHEFNAPGRSPRGRIITRACHIKLPGFTEDTLPKVFGRDDAKQKPANWFTREEFASVMHRMFDDHDVIGEHFLGEMTPKVAQTALH